MFTGTIIGRSGQDLICHRIRPDVVAGIPRDVYAFWVPRQHIKTVRARVRCDLGRPSGIPGFLDEYVTIVEFWVDPARIYGYSDLQAAYGAQHSIPLVENHSLKSQFLSRHPGASRSWLVG